MHEHATNGAAPEPEEDFLDHFFEFPTMQGADKAADALRARGWEVTVRKLMEREIWLVQATQPGPIPEDRLALHTELTKLAEECGGEYDGWEGPL
jgi:hypothetical protein